METPHISVLTKHIFNPDNPDNPDNPHNPDNPDNDRIAPSLLKGGISPEGGPIECRCKSGLR